MSAIEGALKRLSTFVKVQVTPSCRLYYSANFPFTALLVPPSVGGHNQKSKREWWVGLGSGSGGLISPWRGLHSKSFPLPFLTNQAYELHEIGTLLFPARPTAASLAQGHP